jgi:hypothetical protein
VVTSEEFYNHILENAEELDGKRICRVSLIQYLRNRGVKKAQGVRIRLVKDLEAKKLIKRQHPRSIRIEILTDDVAKTGLR